MSIDKMQAGRELDAMVARAMGWSDVTLDNGCRGIPPGNEIGGMRPYKTELVPAWSIDIADAWRVWEWLPRKFHASDVFALEVSLSDCPPWRYDTDPKRRYIVTAKWHGETQYSGAASTPELAICRAALRAMREVVK